MGYKLMLTWLPFIVKNWRYLAVAAVILGALSYRAYIVLQAKQEGKQECQAEVIIKQVEVIKHANQARAQAIVDSSKHDIPDSLRKFYID